MPHPAGGRLKSQRAHGRPPGEREGEQGQARPLPPALPLTSASTLPGLQQWSSHCLRAPPWVLITLRAHADPPNSILQMRKLRHKGFLHWKKMGPDSFQWALGLTLGEAWVSDGLEWEASAARRPQESCRLHSLSGGSPGFPGGSGADLQELFLHLLALSGLS